MLRITENITFTNDDMNLYAPSCQNCPGPPNPSIRLWLLHWSHEIKWTVGAFLCRKTSSRRQFYTKWCVWYNVL